MEDDSRLHSQVENAEDVALDQISEMVARDAGFLPFPDFTLGKQ